MKKIKIIIPIIIIIILILFLLTGLSPRYDVFLKSYKVSSDGNIITLKVGLAGSAGYIRSVKEELKGDNHYLTFYPTFGINTKLGSEEYFDIKINSNAEKIYFTVDNNEYKLILEKDETNNWINPNYNPNQKVKNIVDESENMDDFICAEALENFYSDSKYNYYFGCIKSSYVNVIYEDNTEDSVTNALKNGTIIISDLDKYNISYGKEEKVTNIKNIIDETEVEDGFMCASALEEFYKDVENTYYFSCMKSNYVKVIYNDGTEETVKEALMKNKIMINDLDNYNIKYFKEKNN